jgi:hypothetical protein
MSRDGLEAAGSYSRCVRRPRRVASCHDVPFRLAATRLLPPRQTRRCRRRFRTTTTGRTRPPSIGSDTNLAAHAGSTSLVVHARWSRPAPCRSPRAMLPSGTEAPSGSAACLVKGLRGRLELPRLRVILPPFPARRTRDVRERCVSPTSATDSVHEHLQIARFLAALPLRATSCDASRTACQLTRGPKPCGDGLGPDVPLAE